MRIGASLFLITVGAVLKWAVTDRVNGVNLSTVGVIFMVVGAAGLVLSLLLASVRRRTDVITDGGTRYVAPGQAVDGPSRTTYVEPGNHERL